MKKLFNIIISIFFYGLLFSNELLIPFSFKGKMGFLDEKLKLLTNPDYIGEIISYNDQMIKIKCKGYTVIVGKNGELLTRGVDSLFIIDNEKYAISQEGGSYFSRVFSSEKQVLHMFDKIKIYGSDKQGYLLILDGTGNNSSRYNIMNCGGELLYKNNTFKRIFDYDSERGIALVQNNNFDDCLVSRDGNIINDVEYKFGRNSFNEGFVFGKNLKTGETGFYNLDCKLVIKSDVKVGSTMEDWDAYPSVNCGVVAIVNDGEKNVLLSEWQTLHSDNWSIVDTNGKFLAYGITADYISPFSDDVAVYMLRNGDRWIYRLINKYGNFITNTDYDEIQSSINGYCMAKKNGIDYLISSSDGTVYKCSDFK